MITINLTITNAGDEVYTETLTFTDVEIESIISTGNLGYVTVKVAESGLEESIIEATQEQIGDKMSW